MPDREARRVARHWPEFLLLGLIACAFLPTLSYGFLSGWDDGSYIVDRTAALELTWHNLWAAVTQTEQHNYHPLTTLSLVFDYQLWGLDSRGYRLHNICWHAVAALTVLRLFRALGLSAGSALTLAAVFAVHPQRVESVVWISERKDVLCTALYLLAALTWLQRRGRTHTFDWLPFLFFVLALLAKTMAVSLPVVLLLYEWHRRGQGDRHAKLEWPAFGPYAMAVVLIVPIAYAAQGSAIEAGVSGLRRLGVVLHNLFWYPWRLVLPLDLAPLYARVEFDPATVVALSVATGVSAAAAAVVWRRWPALGSTVVLPLLAAYVVVLGPVSGIVPLGAMDFADRYSYLPSVVLLFGCGLLLRLLPESRRGAPLARLAAVALVAACLSLTSLYRSTFSSMYALWQTACLQARPNPVALGALAEEEILRGRYAAAAALAERLSARRDRSLSPANLQANQLKATYLLGTVQLRCHQPLLAVQQFEQLRPHLVAPDVTALFAPVAVLDKLGEAYRQLGDFSRALTCYEQRLELAPPTYEALVNRGVCQLQLARTAEAEADFEAAVAMQPGRPEARANLAALRQQRP